MAWNEETERWSFSGKALKELKRKAKRLAGADRRKDGCFWRYTLIEKLFDECYEKTGHHLFTYYWSPALKQADRRMNNWKNERKVDLDAELRSCKSELIFILDGLIEMLEKGEADDTD